jgi:hypothetical protein
MKLIVSAPMRNAGEARGHDDAHDAPSQRQR